MKGILGGPIRRKAAFLRRSILTGRATVQGTTDFVDRHSNKIPLLHCFSKSQLSINPYIHGPPRPGSTLTTDGALDIAINSNAMNCLYVYNRYADDSTWCTDDMERIVQSSSYARENFVLMGGFGFCNSSHDIANQMEFALSSCNISHFDFVTIECDSMSLDKEEELWSVVEVLEYFCKEGYLHGYGLAVNIAPYCFHKPLKTHGGKHQVAPLLIEGELARKQHADLILYPISVTNEIPSTYPMLDDDGGYDDREETGEDNQHLFEDTRSITRAAIDPLHCRRGGGSENRFTPFHPSFDHTDDQYVILADELVDPHLQAHVAQHLDALCPPLQSSPRLQDKGLRAVFSVGVEVMVLDAHLSAVVGDDIRIGLEDMLCADDTDDLFENFELPEMETEAVAETEGEGEGEGEGEAQNQAQGQSQA